MTFLELPKSADPFERVVRAVRVEHAPGLRSRIIIRRITPMTPPDTHWYEVYEPGTDLTGDPQRHGQFAGPLRGTAEEVGRWVLDHTGSVNR